jgi:uncharacterized repeat protein (TIGR01451 family)
VNHRARLVGYLLVPAVLAGLLVAIPQAWATFEQSQAAQTVPTRTPKPPPPNTPGPSDEGEPVEVPTQAPTASAPTVSATSLPSPAPSATPSAKLALVMEVAPRQAWPGATLNYTLTLKNKGTGSARQVVVEYSLPDGLDPGVVAQGIDAAWDGRSLRAQAPSLSPGSQLVIVFSAVIRTDAKTGGALVSKAIASTATGMRVTASTFTMLPPAELPPTGGLVEGGCEPAPIKQ